MYSKESTKQNDTTPAEEDGQRSVLTQTPASPEAPAPNNYVIDMCRTQYSMQTRGFVRGIQCCMLQAEQPGNIINCSNPALRVTTPKTAAMRVQIDLGCLRNNGSHPFIEITQANRENSEQSPTKPVFKTTQFLNSAAAPSEDSPESVADMSEEGRANEMTAQENSPTDPNETDNPEREEGASISLAASSGTGPVRHRERYLLRERRNVNYKGCCGRKKQ